MANKSLTFDLYGNDKTASKTLNGVSKVADGFGKKMVGVATAIGAGFATWKVGQFLADFAVDSVNAFRDAQKAHEELQFAFAKFPKLADTNIEAIDKMAKAIQDKTRFDDDAIKSGDAILAQYQLTGKEILKLTPLLVDYAAKTGKDVPQAAEDLGKALLGQGRALKEVGIDFQDTGSVAGNFDQIIAGLRKQVGGFAANELNTMDGKILDIRQRWEEIQETFGAAFAPALENVLTWLETDGMPILERFADWFATTGVPKITEFFGWIDTEFVPAMSRFFDSVKDEDGSLTTFTKNVGLAAGALWGLHAALVASTGPMAIFIGAFTLVAAQIGIGIANFEKLWNWLLEHPWAAAFAPFIGGFVLGGAAIGAFMDKGSQMRVLYQQIFADLMAKVIGWAAEFVAKIQNAAESVGAFANRVRAGITDAQNAIANGVQTMIGKLSEFVGGVRAKVEEAVAAFRTLRSRVIGALSGAGSWLVNAGRQIVNGLISGIRQRVSAAVAAIADIARRMLNAALSAIGARSPSTVYRDKVGKMIPAGIVAGIRAGTPGLTSALNSMMDFPAAGSGVGAARSWTGGSSNVEVRVTQKVGGVSLSDLIDMHIRTASGWQALEFGSGVGR